MPDKSLMVVCQLWEESERGWGCRPDGYSIHLNEDDCLAYILAYNETLPATAPHEYERPDGRPYLATVDVKTFEELTLASLNGKKGIRSFDRAYPPRFVL